MKIVGKILKASIVVFLYFSFVILVNAGITEDLRQGGVLDKLDDAAIGTYRAFFSEVERGEVGALGELIVSMLQLILGALGVAAVVLLVYAGIVWMTAGGNDTKIEQAKKIIQRAIIGLIIIILAYSIIAFFTTIFPQTPPPEENNPVAQQPGGN